MHHTEDARLNRKPQNWSINCTKGIKTYEGKNMRKDGAPQVQRVRLITGGESRKIGRSKCDFYRKTWKIRGGVYLHELLNILKHMATHEVYEDGHTIILSDEEYHERKKKKRRNGCLLWILFIIFIIIAATLL